MSSFTNNIYGADRINQSFAILGGATAQSYGAVGLNKPSTDVESFSTVLDQVTNMPSEGLPSDSPLGVTSALNPLISSTSFASMLTLPSGMASDEQFESSQFSQTNAARDSELMSRFEAVEPELPASFGVLTAQTVMAGDVESIIEGASASTGSTLLDFLEQLISQAEASQAEFNGSLDGDRQSSIRDLIENVAGDTGSTLRATLQEGVEGRGRELVADAIDTSGLRLLEPFAEPVQAIDYYGESAVLINGTLDVLVQPIGSLSLPPVGPTFANTQDELAGFAS